MTSSFFDRGLFGDSDPTLQWTYISIFWRSIWQAGLATILSLLIGFPTAYYIATRPAKHARAVGIFSHHPILGKPVNPHRFDEVPVAR